MVFLVVIPVGMILVFMRGPKALGVARTRQAMILLIVAPVTVRVANSHIADVEGHANSGVGRDGASERRSGQSKRTRCCFQAYSYLFSFGLY